MEFDLSWNIPGVGPYTIIRSIRQYEDLNTGKVESDGPANIPLMDLLNGYRYEEVTSCGGKTLYRMYEPFDNVFCRGVETIDGTEIAWQPVTHLIRKDNVGDWVWLKMGNGALIQVEPEYKLLLERGCVMECAKNIRAGQWLRGLNCERKNQVMAVERHPPKSMTGSVSYALVTPNGFYDIFGYPSTWRNDIPTLDENNVDYYQVGDVWKEYEKVVS